MKPAFQTMSLGDHLDELRARLQLALGGLAVALLVALALGRPFLALLLAPYRTAMLSAGVTMQLQAIEVAEPFAVYLRASMLLAVLLSAPWLFYQLWAFVASGLYRHEQRLVRTAAPVCTLLFVGGVMFFLLAVAPMMFRFFLRFNPGVDYLYQPQLSAAVRFTVRLSLVFGLAFQTPAALVVAERMGLVSVEGLRRARRFVLLGTFVAAAAVTPPDVISQLALAIPLYAFYEGSILICRLRR